MKILRRKKHIRAQVPTEYVDFELSGTSEDTWILNAQLEAASRRNHREFSWHLGAKQH